MKYVLLISWLVPWLANAQSSDSTTLAALQPVPAARRGILLEFGLAPVVTLLPTLRSYLRTNQIRPDAAVNLFFSFGIGLRSNRLKLVGQNGFGLKDANVGDPLAAATTEWVAQNTVANYTTLLVGYDLLNARNHRLYLNVGLGGLAYGVSIARQTNQPLPFQALLQTPQVGAVSSLLLRQVGFFELNLEYALREKRRRSIESLIRVGYRSATFSKAYESTAFHLLDAPGDRASQIYLQTVLSLSTNGDKWRIR